MEEDVLKVTIITFQRQGIHLMRLDNYEFLGGIQL